MAGGVVTVAELENRYELPQGSLDEECTDEHIKEIALLLESWEILASHLGLSTQQIDAIKEDNRSQEVKRMNVLKEWKETFAFKATYRKLLEVLLNINRAKLACIVCQLLTSKQTGPQQTYHHEQPKPVHLVPIAPSMHIERAPSGSSEAIEEIESLFLDLVVNVEEYFEEHVSLKKLQRYSCHLPVNLMAPFGQLFESKESQIWRTQTVHELFQILKYFWDYLHPDLLRYLVSRFAPKDSEIVDQMSGYVTELSSFRKKVKIPDYIGERSINLVDEDYFPIVATLGDEWYEKTLADLEEVRCNFSRKFSFLQLLPKMNGLKFNSIALVFSVPKSVQFNRDELCEFFRSYNVLKLMVGEECIYDDQQSSDSESDGHDDEAVSLNTVAAAGVESEEVVAKLDKDNMDEDRDPQDQVDFITKGFDHEPQPGGFTCEFVEKPPPKLIQSECPVCLQILREPHQVTCCGYSFCRVCIERLKYGNKHCPTCNEESITIFPDKRLQRSLSDYEVYCTHGDKGCTWRGELRQLENHLNEEPQVDRELEGCLFAHVDCKFKSVGCKVRVTRGDIAAHLKDHSEIHLNLLDTAFRKAQEQNAVMDQKILSMTHAQNTMDKQHKKQIEESERLKEQQLRTLKQIIYEYEILTTYVHAVPVPLSSSQASHEHRLTSPFIGTPTPPVTFTMTNFDALKRDDHCWLSPPFYTHHHGYKMGMEVFPNGHPDTDSHGIHVSVYISLKRGEFDNHLKWPFRGDITVTLLDLLDQEDYKRCHSITIPFNDDTPDDATGRVIDGNSAAGIWGLKDFIPHNDVEPRYCNNDCLMFNITGVKLY